MRGLLYYDITTDATAIRAQLEFSYSDSLLASRGLTEAGLVAAFFDESDLTWKSPPSVRDTVLNIIRVTTNHFSVWVIADSTQDIITGVKDLADTPDSYRLGQNWPNPFNPETRISFTLSAPGPVRISIYDALGRFVRTLVDGQRAAGEYTERWDGRDRFGRQVATGVYFYRMDAGGFLQTRKMLLLR